MMERIRELSSQPRASITGVVYLLYFLTAILAQFMAGRNLVAYGNATNLIATGCYLTLTLLFYGLFKPVSKSLSLLAALFSLAGCVVRVFGFFHLASSLISPLLFFGPFCLLIGYLILRSSFLPRVLGVLMAFAGLGWLAFLLPAIPHYLSLAFEVLGFLAELSLCLWLLVMSVNVERWKQQAGGAKASIQTEKPPSTADMASTRG